MRIAFISFEFPPAVAIGGIGTYAFEAARMLAADGCEVEVFAAGTPGVEPASAYGVIVHRLDVPDRAALREAVVPVFATRHRERPFDVLESPEIGAEGALIAGAFPEVAVVVKLHTPSFLVGEAAYEAPSLLEQARFTLGALRRGRLSVLTKPTYAADADLECQFTRRADDIAAPSRAIGDRLTTAWGLDATRLSYFPLPFRPDAALLALPLPEQAATVGFLGRLEARKGIVELARAIPSILHAAPHLRFRLIGPTWPYRQGDMESWIRHHCSPFLAHIDFVGSVSRKQLATELGQCDMVILPSRWENFPFACWESMASGRAVIGSSSGGMADVIEPGNSGLLVPERSPQRIMEAILQLAAKPEAMIEMARQGRQRILDHLSPDRIRPLQIASYKRAIQRCAARQ